MPKTIPGTLPHLKSSKTQKFLTSFLDILQQHHPPHKLPYLEPTTTLNHASRHTMAFNTIRDKTLYQFLSAELYP